MKPGGHSKYSLSGRVFCAISITTSDAVCPDGTAAVHKVLKATGVNVLALALPNDGVRKPNDAETLALDVSVADSAAAIPPDGSVAVTVAVLAKVAANLMLVVSVGDTAATACADAASLMPVPSVAAMLACAASVAASAAPAGAAAACFSANVIKTALSPVVDVQFALWVAAVLEIFWATADRSVDRLLNAVNPDPEPTA